MYAYLPKALLVMLYKTLTIVSILFFLSIQAVLASDLILSRVTGITNFYDLNFFEFTYTPTDVSEQGTIQFNAEIYLDDQLVISQIGEASSSTIIVGQSVNLISTSYMGLVTEQTTSLGAWPEGSYRLCIKAVERGVIKEQCTSFFHKVPFSSQFIRLLTPLNDSEVDLNPLLNWTSTIPPSFAENIGYRLYLNENLVEERNTNATSALGPSILSSEIIYEPTLYYSPNYTPLKKGGTYNWRVELVQNNKVLARSTVWSLHLKDSSPYDKLPITTSYVDVNEVLNNSTFYFLESMKFKATPSRSSEKFSLSIKDSEGQSVKLKQNFILFKRNDPYVLFDMTLEPNLKHMHSYAVTLTSATGVTKNITVIYINPYVK